MDRRVEEPVAGAKLQALREKIAAYESVIVCFSGGVDSALLAAVAAEQLGPKSLAITAHSPSLPSRELAGAKELALELGITHEVVATNEMANPDYVANGGDRCFHCKTELYAVAERKRQEKGFQTTLSGIIADDLGDHRPGIDAARRAGIAMPLADLGFDKSTVRTLAKAVGVSQWNKPAAACLSSRLAYGVEVTSDRLRRVESLERFLKQLGFAGHRVRYHRLGGGDAELCLARIELRPEQLAKAAEPELREAISKAALGLGYRYVTLDLQGYRQGSHNLALRGKSLPVIS